MHNRRLTAAARVRTSAALICALTACVALHAAQPATAPLRLDWELRSRPAHAALPEGSLPAAFTLTNTGQRALSGMGWSLYFNCMVDVDLGGAASHLKLDRVTGPLYRLRPTDGFVALRPGQSLEIPLVHSDSLVNSSLAPEGPYLVLGDSPQAGLPIIDYHRAPLPSAGATTPEQIYARNSRLAPVPEKQLPPVFPTPLRYERREGTLRWLAPPKIVAPAALQKQSAFAAALLRPYSFGAGAAAASPGIRLALARIEGLSGPEAYRLDIDATNGVSLTAESPAGIARGMASLRQLLPEPEAGATGIALPALSITDAPRFAYRGLMLDVARNFQPKGEILRVLDLMSRYKLNTLHLHLTDDEGWRIEIAGLPELTSVGARRGHMDPQQDRLPPAYGSGPDVSDPFGTGYYSRADYVEILQYAAKRDIEVIPEIEMPGHARAALMSMAERARRRARAGERDAHQYALADPLDRSVYHSEQGYSDNVMDPGLPSTYAFIEHVMLEMIALHRAAGVPLRTLHVGGDEVPQGAWERSPACLALMQREHLQSRAELWDYFYRRVGSLLASHGLALAGWEEVGARTQGTGDHSVKTANPVFSGSHYTLHVWRNTEGAEDLADRLANAGYAVVLTPATRLYFDLAPYPSPVEPGQTWAGYVDLDTVFDYVPLDDTRLAPDNPRRLADRVALTDSGRGRIRGLEGTLFSETVHEAGRIDYMLMPRLLALAERAWAADPAWAREANAARAAALHAAAWSLFVSQVGLQVLPRLDAEHAVLYRIPAPGLGRGQGGVLVNEQLPGFSLRYTVDGGEPGPQSPKVDGPITATGLIRVAAFDRNGRAGRSSQLENH